MAHISRGDVLTAAEFSRMPNSTDWELVDGTPAKRRKGNRAAWIAGRLTGKLASHIRERQLGWVFGPGAGFIMDPKRPDTVRRASGSFVSFERLQNKEPSETFDAVTPDLAIEVVGMADTVPQMIDRAREYLSNGMQIVWLIEPLGKCIRILSVAEGAEGSMRLGIDDELNGRDVVPGFRCKLSDLFTFPKPVGS
jgi:Uma2 family endonuclease